MPIEELYNIYLGKTQKCVYLYLGNWSAQLAKFLYEKAGVEFHVQKTDVLVSKDDFLYLDNTNAVTFKNTNDLEEVKRCLRTLLDAYDIMRRYDLANAHMFKNMTVYKVNKENIGCSERTAHVTYRFSAGDSKYSPRNMYDGCDHVLFNKEENVAIFLKADELPEYKDPVLNFNDWTQVAFYNPSTLDQIAMTGEPVRDILRRTFHRASFNHDVLSKKLIGFQDMYCDSV